MYKHVVNRIRVNLLACERDAVGTNWQQGIAKPAFYIATTCPLVSPIGLKLVGKRVASEVAVLLRASERAQTLW